MSAYQFRFTTIQKLRSAELDHRRQRWADACRALAALADHRDALDHELAELRGLQRANHQARQLDVDKLLAAERHVTALLSQRQELVHQEKTLAAEVDQCRLDVAEAQRDVRALELLDERQRARHREDQARVATRNADETSLERHGRCSS